MTRVLEGKLVATGLKVAIVASRFNAFIVEHLVNGALDALRRSGADEGHLTVVWAPGAFDLPPVLAKVLDGGHHDAIVCVGAVIRGGTPHFEHVANTVTRGVAQLALEAKIPVTFGVLTTDSVEQAIERAGTKAGNKGFEAAMAAIELANLYRELSKR